MLKKGASIHEQTDFCRIMPNLLTAGGSDFEGFYLVGLFFVDTISIAASFEAFVIGADDFVDASELILCLTSFEGKVDQHISMLGSAEARA